MAGSGFVSVADLKGVFSKQAGVRQSAGQIVGNWVHKRSKRPVVFDGVAVGFVKANSNAHMPGILQNDHG